MSGFFDYLDKNDKKIINVVKEKVPLKKNKVLAMNVEIRSVDGAKLVIEKLQNWIREQTNNVDGIEKEKKVTYKIPPKKIIKSPVLEARNHALAILEGLPDDEIINENHNNIGMKQNNTNLESVTGHASALL